ncbi:class II aldolase/adducin head domain-containing protein [Humibacter ginsengisoli]
MSETALLRSAVVRACRYLSAAGLSPGSSGNVSVRSGSRIMATPTGSSLRSVAEDDLALVPFESPGSSALPGPSALPGSSEQKLASGLPDAPRPTKELPLREAMYAAHPDATAVVHLHSPYATAIACLAPDDDGFARLPPLTPYRVMRLGTVPLVPYAKPGSPELAAAVASRAHGHPVLLLANHGPIVAARDLDAAIDLAEELEAAARLTLQLHTLSPVLLDAAAVASLTPPGR